MKINEAHLIKKEKKVAKLIVGPAPIVEIVKYMSMSLPEAYEHEHHMHPLGVGPLGHGSPLEMRNQSLITQQEGRPLFSRTQFN